MPNTNQPGEFLIDESCLNLNNETYLINPDDFIEPEVTDKNLDVLKKLSEPVNMGNIYSDRGSTLDSPTTRSLMKFNKCCITIENFAREIENMYKKNKASSMYRHSVEYYLENV